MITLNVPDMHCGNCVKRINAALQEAGISCSISLEGKTVSVDEEKLAAAIEALDDLGFAAQV